MHPGLAGQYQIISAHLEQRFEGNARTQYEDQKRIEAMSLEEKQIGHYHLLHVIGRGGMGEVYLGEDHRVHREVAVKIIQLQARQESEEKGLRLFLHEVKTIAQLDHPGILPLYDYGEETIDGMPCAYLITPYRVEGSLDTWLRKRAQHQQTRNLTGKQVTHLINQAAEALQYAHDHDQHIIHLDVKPANFLIRSQSADDEYPDLQLADFGIARFMTGAASTVSQHVRGTSSYMAPEQWEDKPDFRSDQYALAIMTYELLTGRPPFHGAPLHMMYAHLSEIPRSPSEINPLLLPNVDEVVLRALEKKPEERFPSVLTFAQELQTAFEKGDEHATVRVLLSSPFPPSLQQSSSTSPAFTTIEETPASSLAPTKHAAPLPVNNRRRRRHRRLRTRRAATPPGNNGATPIPDRRPPTLTLSYPTRMDHRLLVWRAALSVGILLLLGSGLFAALEASGFLKTEALSPAHLRATAIARITGTATAQATGTAIAREPGSIWVAHDLQGAEASGLLSGITWSGQQKQYVAVGYDSQGQGVIVTSPDGITWVSHSPDIAASLDSITWSASRSQYIALGDGVSREAILTSSDGQTWTPHFISDTLLQLNSVACSDLQCIVVGDGETFLASANEQDWTYKTYNTGIDLRGIVWSEEQRQFVVVGDDGTILTSPDGQTWTPQDADPDDSYEDIIWSGSEYVAAGLSGTIITSPDGKHWTQQVSDMQDVSDSYGGSESFIFNAVAVAGSHYVAVAEKDDGLESTWAILTASAGQNWTIQRSGILTDKLDPNTVETPNLLEDIVWSGSRFVAVGDAGTILISPGASESVSVSNPLRLVATSV